MNDERKYSELFLVGLATALACGAGCGPVDPGGTGGNGGAGSDLVSTTGPEHCGTITSDEIWAADRNPHIVTCDVLLEGGTLRVGPGTEVLFAKDTALRVSKGGGTASFEVEGVADAPVTFRAQSGTGPGLWAGMSMSPAAGKVSLRHATIDSAGGFNTSAALQVEGTDIHADHLTITNADEVGVRFQEFGGLDAESTALVISKSTGYPVVVDPDRADSLPSVDSAYDGNTSDMIRVEGKLSSHREIRGARTWEDVGVPYLAASSITLNGTAMQPAVLTLLDGVTVMFEAQSEMAGGKDGAAGIITQGTTDRPVVLTSVNGQARGAWAGIKAGDNMVDDSFRLENTIIEWGGGFNNVGCLNLTGTSVQVKNVTLRGCDGPGFDFFDHASFQDGSTGLVVHDSDNPGKIWASVAHTIPEEGIDLSGNDDPAMLVTYGHQHAITGEVTWGDIGASYRCETGIVLNGTAGKPSILNLVPGLRLEFGIDGIVRIGTTGAGGLRAKGTAVAPIVFTGAAAANPGAWGGIDIGDLSVDADTVFEYALIEYGGGKNSQANIRIDSASPTLTSTRIENSEKWGIYLLPGAAPNLTDVTFSGNALGDVHQL